MADILVVDDYIQTALALKRLLNLAGHTTECVTSGPAALEMVRRAIPDFVILDYMMPGIDGLQVLKALRAQAETANLPVVLYTAVSDPDVVERARLCGATEVWTKMSIGFTEMMHRIDQLLAKCPTETDGKANGPQAAREIRRATETLIDESRWHCLSGAGQAEQN